MNTIDMENILIYLLKASIGMLLFYLFYVLVLRKETYYASNRIYLVLGLILAVLLPIFPITYVSPVALINNSEFFTIGSNSVQELPSPVSAIREEESFWQISTIISSIYVLGVISFLLRLLLQTAFLYVKIQIGAKSQIDGITVINLKHSNMPFSFFEVVFIHIEAYSKEELSNIIAHEKVHIQERHWVDLLIVELLTVVFWMNPIVWLYERSVKQNHEYLADQGVLRAGYPRGRYQAVLINQFMGVNVMGFTNNLNFSLNKKRMEMMKKDKSPRIKRMKLLIALPVVAALMFAFAEPEYLMVETIKNEFVPQLSEKVEMILVKGIIKDENGIPLSGANIIREGTSDGTVSDNDGAFAIKVPKLDKPMTGISHDNHHEVINANTLLFSYIGFESHFISFDSRKERVEPFKIKMIRGVFNIELSNISEGNVKMQAPPPPPPKVSEADKDKVFTVVEEMPYYSNGGMTRLALDIDNEVVSIMKKTGDRGNVLIGFTIDKNGSITNAHLVESAYSKMLDAAALQIIQKLDNWNPAIQCGKKVPVSVTVPVRFN